MLHLFNFLFLQWFCLRLGRWADNNGNSAGWMLMKVLPVTGYFGIKFKFWGKSIFFYEVQTENKTTNDR